jgi:hypothetical protein
MATAMECAMAISAFFFPRGARTGHGNLPKNLQ